METTSFLIAAAVLLVLNHSISSLSITNLTTDQSALLSFKSYITLDPYNVLADNWSTSTSVCNWVGITCGVLHQRVTSLNLSDMSLTGSLSPHLGNLSFLSLLDIGFNDFHGQIPEELSRLHRLKQVNFDYNNITGDLNSYSWFGNLPELQYLLLYNNSFTGTIGSSLCNISNLEGLDLGQNYLQGNIPDEIGKLSNLKFLNLESNQITGSIPSAMFFNMSSLQTIALTYNNLYDSLPVYVCDHLPNLQLFYVSANRFYGEIPSSLYKCRELQYLSLSFNSFNGSIPREIGNLTMLKELYIGYNDFKEYGMEGIVSAKGDVYSYGIMLMEVFTRKKPTDEMFEGEMSLKSWVSDMILQGHGGSILLTMDSNLIGSESEDVNFTVKEQCVLSALSLAMYCLKDQPNERINMKDASARLRKIRTVFLANNGKGLKGKDICQD